MGMVTSIKRAKAVAVAWVLGDHVAAQWGRTTNETENGQTLIVVRVAWEVQGGVSLRQFHPSIDFLLPTTDPPRQQTMVLVTGFTAYFTD
jgi:hypothetical protein